MLLGIDHLVLAVRSPEAAAEIVERDLGLECTGGGRHEAMGTYNRLAFLGDTYLELIGVFDDALARSSASFAVGNASLALLEGGREGLATFALASDDVRGDVARPVAGERRRTDGEAVRWITAFPELGPERAPFLIEHELTGAEWGHEARTARAAFRHPAGGRVRLAGVELPVGDAAGVAREYGAVLGIAFSEGWRTAVGRQQVVLREGAGTPVVTLHGETGTERLEVERLGVRWRLVPTERVPA